MATSPQQHSNIPATATLATTSLIGMHKCHRKPSKELFLCKLKQPSNQKRNSPICDPTTQTAFQKMQTTHIANRTQSILHPKNEQTRSKKTDKLPSQNARCRHATRRRCTRKEKTPSCSYLNKAIHNAVARQSLPRSLFLEQIFTWQYGCVQAVRRYRCQGKRKHRSTNHQDPWRVK